MVFTRFAGATLILSVLLLGNTAFAVTQNSAESLNRLSAEATRLNIALDETARNKVQNSCQTTQTSLKSIRQKEQRIQRERTDTYLDVQNEIDALQLRLKRQGLEVNNLGATLLTYRELTDQYDRLSKPYLEALNDVVIIDCRANPEAFITGVAIVRQKRNLLLENANSIQQFIFNDIQNQFNAIKDGLKV
jgi:hypothetical protein